MRTVNVRGVDLVIHERADWQTSAEPIRGPSAHPELVEYAVAHHMGATGALPLDMAAHLRSQQHWALTDPSKGYSYWYNFLIDPWTFGHVWECRGFDLQNAANNGDFPPFSTYSNPNFNGHSVSIQFPSSDQAAPNPTMYETFRYVLAMCDDHYGRTLKLQGHKDSDSTSCPGTAIYGKLGELAVRPLEEGDVTKDEVDQALAAALKPVIDKLNSIDAELDGKLSTRRFETFAGNVNERLDNIADRVPGWRKWRGALMAISKGYSQAAEAVDSDPAPTTNK